MKKLYIGAGVLLFLAAVVFLGSSFLRGKQETNNTWKTAIVTRKDIGSTVLATGIIKPMVGAEVRVGSRVSGIVQHLFYHSCIPVFRYSLILVLKISVIPADINRHSCSNRGIKILRR